MRKPLIAELEIPGAYQVVPDVHMEPRGSILSLCNEHYRWRFVEDKISRSHKGVLRGFHVDFRTTKLMSCLGGDVQFVLLDCRPWSPKFGQILSSGLSAHNSVQILVPPGVANAHLCVSDNCCLWYKLSHPYTGPETQIAVRWDTVSWVGLGLGVEPKLSERDRLAPRFADIKWVDVSGDLTYGVHGPTGSKLVVGCASGHFNPAHRGHLALFRAAKDLCDELVVIVNNDQQVALKGSRKCMVETERLEMVADNRYVDRAVLSVDRDRSVSETLAGIAPTYFFMGGDVTLAACRERAVCERLGIKMLFGVGGEKIQSSSQLLAGT